MLLFFWEKKPKPFANCKTHQIRSVIVNITEKFYSNSILPKTITNRIYVYLISPP